MPKRRIQPSDQTDLSSSSVRISIQSNPSDSIPKSSSIQSNVPIDHKSQTNQISSSDQSTIPSVIPRRLGLSFFDQPCIDLAKSLLGKLLVRKLTAPNSTESILLTSRIVETESYLGGDDRASNSFNGRKTDRNLAMYMSPGTCYVYLTYGMYDMINISSQGDGAAVLIRSAEPITGIEHMQELRRKSQKSKKPKIDISDTVDSMTPVPAGKVFKKSDICGGPAKLCMAMNINRQFNQVDLCQCEEFYVADDGFGVIEEEDIVSCARIGINNCGEWTSKPLRFYIRSSEFVSVKVKDQK